VIRSLAVSLVRSGLPIITVQSDLPAAAVSSRRSVTLAS